MGADKFNGEGYYDPTAYEALTRIEQEAKALRAFRPVVYICSPLGGDVKGNLQRVKQYARYALLCGTAPVVPHFYALCLNDDNPKEREIGLAAGLSLLWFCDELWVFGDRVSHGMEKEINFAKNLNIRTVYIKESQVKQTLKKQGGNYNA